MTLYNSQFDDRESSDRADQFLAKEFQKVCDLGLEPIMLMAIRECDTEASTKRKWAGV